MTILLMLPHIILIFGLSYFLWRKQKALKQFFWPALAIKLIAGVCLGLVYTYYYSVADTFVYFNDGSRLASLALQDFNAYVRLLLFNTDLDTMDLSLPEPRALFLTKITSVFNLLTHNNYWVTGFYYSFISFSGAWLLVRIIHRHIPSAGDAALAAFLFLPSVVFWSSGLLKESLALASLYFLTGIFLKCWFGEKTFAWEYVLTVISLWVLWNLKYYYAGIFLPLAGTTLLYKFLIGRRLSSSPGLEFLVWMAMMILPAILITFLHPNFNPHRLLQVIAENNAAYHSLSAPEDLVHFNDLHANVFSFLKNSPWALFSGLFRPLFWEVPAIIQVLPAAENTLLLCLFLAACYRYKTCFPSPHRLLLLAAMVYVVLLCILITFSAPNFGTLSRYRTGYISFFVLIILCNNPLLKYIERSIRRLVSH